jgi:hypothetical protein
MLDTVVSPAATTMANTATTKGPRVTRTAPASAESVQRSIANQYRHLQLALQSGYLGPCCTDPVLRRMEWRMSQRKMQQRTAEALAISGPVRFEARPASRPIRLLVGILHRFAGRKSGTAEDQARVRARLE